MLSAICSRQTNHDLLGIGVRVGVYIQYFAGLQQMSSHEDRVTVFRQSMIFTICYAIALLWLLIENKLDSYNLLPALMLGRMIASLGSLTLTFEPKKKRVLVDLLAYTFYSAISIWFWCVGYQRADITDCGPVYAAFFGFPVRAFGWYRYLEIFVTVGLLPCAVAYSYFVYLVSYIEGDDSYYRGMLGLSGYDMLQWAEYIRVRRFWLAFLLFPVLMATVELLMYYNGLTTDFNNLKRIGQLFPLLLSISSVIQVHYEGLNFWPTGPDPRGDLARNRGQSSSDDLSDTYTHIPVDYPQSYPHIADDYPPSYHHIADYYDRV